MLSINTWFLCLLIKPFLKGFANYNATVTVVMLYAGDVLGLSSSGGHTIEKVPESENTKGAQDENVGVVMPSAGDGPCTKVGPTLVGNTPSMSSYANVTGVPSRKALNFRTLFTPIGNGADVMAYPVVANYVRNTLGKYRLVKSMLNSSTWIFSFQFSSIDGLDVVLENGPWFIRNNPFILKNWSDVNLLREDVDNVLVWVKLHGVPVNAFSEDGLSAISTKLGTPLMFDSYTSDM
ncbi:putative reverse transcriptase domain-containing protein [Tanacetum coccineum]